MAFNNVTIYDGGVTRLEFRRNLVPVFDRCQILRIFYLNGVAVLFQITAPVVTAASGRRFENCDDRQALRTYCRLSRYSAITGNQQEQCQHS